MGIDLFKFNAKMSFCSSDEKSDKTFLICSEVLLLFNSMNLKFKYTKETEKTFQWNSVNNLF